MDSRSCPCLKSELDLFTVSPTQLAIENSSFIEIHPVASLKEKTPIEFVISGSGHYLDLSNSLLHIQLKIVKKNGDSIVEADKVSCINYILNSIFSECSVFFNDKLVSSQVNYAYRSIIEALLFMPENSQKSLLTAGLYFKDENNFDAVDPKTVQNPGLVSRYNCLKLSKVVDLCGILHGDIFRMSKLLPNSIDVRIQLERSKDSFCLMSPDDNFKIEITHASLFIRKVSVAPSIVLAHERALSGGVMKFPLRRVDVKTFLLSPGLQSTIISNAFIGQLPTRIILGLVSNAAFNGDLKKNPFKFHHYNLSYICLREADQTIPSKPYLPNYDSSLYARNYVGLFSNLNRIHTDQNINISYEEYSKGLALYAFDLTPDFSAGEIHTSVTRNGNLSIDMKFSTALDETVNIIVYSEFRNCLESDASRTIFTDY